MMEKTIRIHCKNNGKEIDVPMGCHLKEVYNQLGLQMDYGPMIARVNNKIEGLHYRIYNPKEIEFMDLTTPSGIRAYTRTLFFILAKATHDLYPECKVSIDIPVSNGYYVNLNIGHEVTIEDADRTARDTRRRERPARQDEGDHRCGAAHPPL